MTFDYTIKYCSENIYENKVFGAFWQFMVSPENNESQELISSNFSTSIDTKIEKSINGFGFQTVRVHCKNAFDSIKFEAEFKLLKKEINPFNFSLNENLFEDYQTIENLVFKVEHESFLTPTQLTSLPQKHQDIYTFNHNNSIVDNLIALNEWVYIHIYFKTNVTHIGTLLDEIIENRHGVCQDFSHLFIAIARKNGIPTRYVSGYLHQGDGFFGDSQMHSWVEAFVPNVGWMGFDPTNNLLVNHNHIKVSHGKDYNDCAPLKGIIYTSGKNETKYSVEVSYQQ
jgi:transglutaminase-like putative cysteine protease